MSQINTENDRKVPFSKILRIFRQTVDKLRGLECFEGSTRKRLVVQYTIMRRQLQSSERKCIKLTPKMTKISKLSNFQKFYAFFPMFEELCGLER